MLQLDRSLLVVAWAGWITCHTALWLLIFIVGEILNQGGVNFNFFYFNFNYNLLYFIFHPPFAQHTVS